MGCVNSGIMRKRCAVQTGTTTGLIGRKKREYREPWCCMYLHTYVHAMWTADGRSPMLCTQGLREGNGGHPFGFLGTAFSGPIGASWYVGPESGNAEHVAPRVSVSSFMHHPPTVRRPPRDKYCTKRRVRATRAASTSRSRP